MSATIVVVPQLNFLPMLESKSVGADPSKPKCQKAKAMRIERKRQKLAANGIEVQSTIFLHACSSKEIQ